LADRLLTGSEKERYAPKIFGFKLHHVTREFTLQDKAREGMLDKLELRKKTI
jgi:hypothetical protein